MFLIANPHARRVRKHPTLVADLQRIGGADLVVHLPETLKDLRDLAVNLATTHPNTPIAILGGDGTLGVTLDALAHAWGEAPLPPILPLQGGTTNSVATSMVPRMNPRHQLQKTLSGIAAGRVLPVTRHLLRVDGRHHGFLFGVGLIPRFLEIYYEADDPTPVSAASTLARVTTAALVRRSRYPALFAGLHATVHVDGDLVHDGPTLNLGAGTTDDAGLRFRPFSLAVRHPGRMHALVSTHHLPAMVLDLLRYRFALPARAPGSVERPAGLMRVQLRAPAPWSLDGDLHPATDSLLVEMGPAVTFLLPKVRRGVLSPTDRPGR